MKKKLKIHKKKVDESKDEEKILIESARIASSKALRTSIALGLSVKVIRKNKIITLNPDKTQKEGRTISKSSRDISKLKKGVVLERK